jgi:hypothetical protein
MMVPPSSGAVVVFVNVILLTNRPCTLILATLPLGKLFNLRCVTPPITIMRDVASFDTSNE